MLHGLHDWESIEKLCSYPNEVSFGFKIYIYIYSDQSRPCTGLSGSVLETSIACPSPFARMVAWCYRKTEVINRTTRVNYCRFMPFCCKPRFWTNSIALKLPSIRSNRRKTVCAGKTRCDKVLERPPVLGAWQSKTLCHSPVRPQR